MRSRPIHWAGGVQHARGEWLPGWPCCCSGERAYAIEAEGNLSRAPDEVTCGKCLATMRRDVHYARRFPIGVGQEARDAIAAQEKLDREPAP